jgi:hypothetical protein
MDRSPTQRPPGRSRQAEVLPADDLDALRRENEFLRRALAARKLIERAKGILMREERLWEPLALRRIQKARMDNRTSLDEVARAVIASCQPWPGAVTHGAGSRPAPRRPLPINPPPPWWRATSLARRLSGDGR